MSSSGIKIKQLAKELGVTSRFLLDRCRAEGLPAQNSVTKLSRSQALLVRSWFQDRDVALELGADREEGDAP